MKKAYDASYFEGSVHKVIRLYTSRSEDESIAWLEAHMGASNVTLKPADTTDAHAGRMIVRI